MKKLIFGLLGLIGLSAILIAQEWRDREPTAQERRRTAGLMFHAQSQFDWLGSTYSTSTNFTLTDTNGVILVSGVLSSINWLSLPNPTNYPGRTIAVCPIGTASILITNFGITSTLCDTSTGGESNQFVITNRQVTIKNGGTNWVILRAE